MVTQSTLRLEKRYKNCDEWEKPESVKSGITKFDGVVFF